MIQTLDQILTLADTAKLAYLNPILELFKEQGGLSVAALNYDTLVEQVGELNGVVVDDGIARWKSGPGVHGRRRKLYKLHGSLPGLKTRMAMWCIRAPSHHRDSTDLR